MNAFEQLLTSESRGSVNPETLEYIGQKASNEFFEKKASLNAAIVKLAGQHPELNNEHIHRIVEFANNATFQRLFEQDKDKNVHFPIADPGVVIRDLRDGGSPAHSGKVLNNRDYNRLPIKEEKNSEMTGGDPSTSDPESGLADLFGRENMTGEFGQGEAIQKVASAAGLDPSWEGSANPINDIYATHTKLQRAQSEMATAHESADLMLKQASADFYKAARAEVISPDGAGFRGVIEAMSQVFGPLTAGDVTKVAEQLMRAGATAGQLESGKMKTAGKLLNPAHPLVSSAAAMMKCSEERDIAFGALQEINAGLVKTAAFLRAAK